jgi:hypothetical protein
MKQFQKLVFQPGINREGTNYAAEGFWWDCDRVRFRKGLPETIGGWVKHCAAQFIGVCRALRSWILLDGSDMLAVGTSKKLYIETGEALYDITPIVATFTETSPITSGAAHSAVVTVTTSTPHGASLGDYFIITGAASVDSIPAGALNGEHVVTSVPSSNSVTFEQAYEAVIGAQTGGGAGVQIDFLFGVGADTASVGSGWGVGPYSRGAYGSAWTVPYSSYDSVRLWSFTNYGEDLVAAAYGKAPYYWDATTGLSVRAKHVNTLAGATGVPAAVGYVLVTNERHLVAFGATDAVSGVFDPMLIRWASQEDPADWTPTVSNTAGDYRLAAGDHIEAIAPARDEILVLTDVALYSMRYTGPPYVFDIRQVADNISAAGPNAVLTINNVTYWMGHYKFYLYNGTSQSIPCSVHRHVFNDFNHAQARQVCAGAVEQFSEVWWFYPSADSEVLDKYVVFNYADNIWFVGTLGRTAWVKDVMSHGLIAANADGFLYVHEFGIEDGTTEPASPLGAFIESSDFDLQDGTSHYFVERIIPDIRFDRSTSTAPEVHFTLKARDFPGQEYQPTAPLLPETAVVRNSSVPVDQYTREVWVRVRGRHVALRVEMDPDDAGTAWQLGYPRLSVRTDGRR